MITEEGHFIIVLAIYPPWNHPQAGPDDSALLVD